MLIKLKKDWSLYKAGRIVDVSWNIGKVLMSDGIGVNAEKPEIAVMEPPDFTLPEEILEVSEPEEDTPEPLPVLPVWVDRNSDGLDP